MHPQRVSLRSGTGQGQWGMPADPLSFWFSATTQWRVSGCVLGFFVYGILNIIFLLKMKIIKRERLFYEKTT